MRATFLVFAVFCLAILPGCFQGILDEKGGTFFRGRTLPTTPLELVEAQRQQKLAEVQLVALKELVSAPTNKERKSARESAADEARQRSREEIYGDAKLVQKFLDKRPVISKKVPLYGRYVSDVVRAMYRDNLP